MHFNLTLSLDCSIDVHCSPLSAGVVLVGHCGDVLVFSVFRMIGTFSGVVLCIVGLSTSSLYHRGLSTLLFTV